MVSVQETYEIEVYPSEWNTIVSEYTTNRKNGCDTLLERSIAGEEVRCIVTGYSWKDSGKPHAPQKQKILVRIAEIKN